MPIKYKVAHKSGKYTDANGQEKNRWQNVGVVIESDKYPGSHYLKLEYLPAGFGTEEGGIWFNLFEPRDNKEAPREKAAPAANPSNNFDDDIPF